MLPPRPAARIGRLALVALAMLRGNPLESLACLAVIASGVPFYLAFSRRASRE